MKPEFKILGWLALLGGGAYGLSKLFGGIKTADTGKKMSVTVISLNKPEIQNGALLFSVNVAFDNPTSNPINLKKPTVKVFYNGKEVANSIPSNEYVPIVANDRTIITGINIQIPFLKLGGLLISLIAGNIPKMVIDIAVHAVANGIPYTDKKNFKL